MGLFDIFKKKKNVKTEQKQSTTNSRKQKRSSKQVASRKGELGEYKIDIQLDQLPKDYRCLNDLLVENPKAKSGYSQVDHVIVCPYGIFVIETKNYQGTIYGGKDRKTWIVNGKFKMMNPFVQNYGHIQALKTLVNNKYHDLFISIVSFTKRSTFKVGVDFRKIASDELLVYDIELSEFIHRKVSRLKLEHSKPLLNDEEISMIYNRFSDANIPDPSIRENHAQALKSQTPEATKTKSTCIICKKPVSEKVKNYCLSNTKFNSKIYCFDHQKTLQ